MKNAVWAISSAVVLLFGAWSPGPADSYNLGTHADLAGEAFVQAGTAGRLPSYGVDAATRLRDRDLTLRLSRRSARDWVIQGARDEDMPDIRVLNHFHDPYYNRGLTIHVQVGHRAPDWALEDVTEYPVQNHSYRDAREAFYGALILPERVSREGEFGRTFYALGHVIHLIQDVTVPEHARNDAHFVLGAGKSMTEAYIQNNREAFFPIAAKLSQAGMPVVALPRELWVNGAGTGIAQFTNANFISPDTNFTDAYTGATGGEYPKPTLDLGRVDAPALWRCRDMQPVTLPGFLFFFGNVMPDPVGTATLVNSRMTAYSLFDQHLKNAMKGMIFSVNCFTVDAAAELLLPRAASYSASLLKYFFRGRPTVLLGGGGMRIINRTVDVGRAETMTGRFELYRDDAVGRRQLLAGWDLSLPADVTSGPLPVPLLPDGDTSRCILVFRGRIGDELDGVAGQQLDRCPTAAALAAPAVELGLDIGFGPSSGGSIGCYMQGWVYLLEVCCGPGESPHYVSRCATTVAGAITACLTGTAFYYVCRLPS
jgi:hypothetical protein